MRDFKNHVIFVGAGPGDPELISIKGLKAIQRADVILYDALVSTDLLSYSKPGCKHVYVGKRKGKKEFPQDEINKLIVFYAQRFATVVRLKGGDPYVFGRGHEELEFVSRNKIAAEVVPGISSSIAAPASAGIPLTKRGVNESFWVVTGTLSSGELSNDLEHAARSSATVIILMGISQLERIAELFSNLRSVNEPVAVIQEGTLPTQKVITATAGSIAEAARRENIASPGVIVIGKVVEEREALIQVLQKNNLTVSNPTIL
jgi:uroporphyrin-III C-methyltransferase